MKQNLFNKLWLRVGMIVAIMTTALSGTAWATDISLSTTEIEITDFSAVGSSYLTTATIKEIGGYSWTVYQCMNLGKYSGVTYNNLQMKSGQGTFTSPTISSSQGFTVTVTYSSTKALTLQIGEETAQTGTTTTSNSQAGTGATVTATTTSTSTFFKISAGSATTYVSSIKITPTSGGTPTPTTYTVTYNANGGSGTMTDSNSPYASGATVTVLDNEFTRTDYDFTGWNTAADGSGTGYDADDTFTINANTTLYAQWEEQSGDAQWVLTSLADLTSSDVFVIVGDNSYAMTNNNGTSSAPATSAVTITGSTITSTVDANIKWNVSGNATDGYTFYPNGTTTTWLYCTNTNNGVRVGTNNDNKTFKLDNNNYLVNQGTNRYLSHYSNEWRCYGNTNNNPFVVSFYKKVTGGVIPPSITASTNEIAYDATSGSITYSVANPVEGGAVTATSSESWLTVGTPSDGTIALTCAANSETTARTAIVTLTYTYNTNKTATTTVTVTQAAAPVIYTTIPALFAAATSTATDVNITFDDWVVSAVHSNNAYLTDNQGNGLIIYATGHGFLVGDVLTGTVSCKLQLYRGSAELTELTTSTTGLSVAHNGTVTEQNIAISELSGVNTGALVAYEGLTYNGTALVDGNSNAITPYSTLYEGTFENGKTYNVTGIYLQYNTTKELLPRSAADIVEVVITTPAINVASTTIDASYAVYNGTINITYENFTPALSEVIFCDVNGDAATYDWITAVINNENNVEYHLNENTGAARTAYMKVYALDNEANELYSELITINQAALPSGDQYELFSGDLVEGDYIIYYDGKAMNTTVTSDRLQYEEVTPESDIITTDDAAIVWHIAPSGNYWTIYNAAANAYAASTGVKNKAQMLADGTDDKALWTVSGTETYDFVNVENTANLVNAHLRNNGTYGFACYAEGTGGALTLYKKVVPATVPVALNAYGYTTFSSNYAVSIPENGDFTAWQITNIDNDNKITFVQVTGNVKAGTGLFLKGTASDEITIETAASGAELQDNILVGFPTATNVTAGEYYGLSGNQFKKVGAGTVKAGKALLPVGYINESNGVKPFTFVFEEDDATAIEMVNGQSSMVNGPIYNLAGQRISKMQKGINIVNGKKVLK